MSEAVANRITDDDFTLPGFEPAAFEQLHFWLASWSVGQLAHFEAVGHHAANGNVHFTCSIFARQHDDNDPFARGHGLAVAVFCNSGERLQRGEQRSIEATRELRLRSLPENKDVLRATAADEC